MSRYAPSSPISYSFGPGPITFAVKWIIIINVGVFVVTTFAPSAIEYFGLIPERVIERGWIWQLVTYMFLHGGALHILFNMLGHLDVRRRARAAMGHTVLHPVLRRQRHRRRAHVPAHLAPAFRRDRGDVRDAGRGCVRCALRPAAGVCDLLPRAADSAAARVRAGPNLRDDLRRPGAAQHLPAQPRRRRRRPPRRHDLRLPVSEGRPRRPDGRDQVPVSEVEDEPPAPQVRRLLWRAIGFEGPESDSAASATCESTCRCDRASPGGWG